VDNSDTAKKVALLVMLSLKLLMQKLQRIVQKTLVCILMVLLMAWIANVVVIAGTCHVVMKVQMSHQFMVCTLLNTMHKAVDIASSKQMSLKLQSITWIIAFNGIIKIQTN